jgi:predicted RNase H-like nuclease (RuvC/YqgF family)
MIIILNKETNRVEGVHTSSPKLEEKFADNNPLINTLKVNNDFKFSKNISLYEVVDEQVQLIEGWEAEKLSMEAEEQRSEIEELEARLAELKS